MKFNFSRETENAIALIYIEAIEKVAGDGIPRFICYDMKNKIFLFTEKDLPETIFCATVDKLAVAFFISVALSKYWRNGHVVRSIQSLTRMRTKLETLGDFDYIERKLKQKGLTPVY